MSGPVNEGGSGFLNWASNKFSQATGKLLDLTQKIEDKTSTNLTVVEAKT